MQPRFKSKNTYLKKSRSSVRTSNGKHMKIFNFHNKMLTQKNQQEESTNGDGKVTDIKNIKIPSTPDIEAYIKNVEYMACNHISDFFYNSGPFHAGIVMQNLFKSAEKYVNIFAGDINGTISSYYIDEMGEFLTNNKNSHLTILLENEPSSTAPILSKLKYLTQISNLETRIKIGVVTNKDAIIKQNDSVVHFTISDDRMYRLEEDTENYFAKVNFNDPSKTLELKDIFNKLKLNCLPIRF